MHTCKQAWNTKGQPYVHINFRPILRDNFDYSAYHPLSSVEKGGCVTSLFQYRQSEQPIKPLPLSLDNKLGLLLKGNLHWVYV